MHQGSDRLLRKARSVEAIGVARKKRWNYLDFERVSHVRLKKVAVTQIFGAKPRDPA